MKKSRFAKFKLALVPFISILILFGIFMLASVSIYLLTTKTTDKLRCLVTVLKLANLREF